MNTDPKAAIGSQKPQLHLNPPAGSEEQAKALACGRAKYGERNWIGRQANMTTYISAAKRHLDALMDGEDIDPESGAHHLGHVMAGCSIMLDALRHGTLVDDRVLPVKTAPVVEPVPEGTTEFAIPWRSGATSLIEVCISNGSRRNMEALKSYLIQEHLTISIPAAYDEALFSKWWIIGYWCKHNGINRQVSPLGQWITYSAHQDAPVVEPVPKPPATPDPTWTPEEYEKAAPQKRRSKMLEWLKAGGRDGHTTYYIPTIQRYFDHACHLRNWCLENGCSYRLEGSTFEITLNDAPVESAPAPA